jgi:tryptophan 2,3-dioxygenase
MTTPAKSAPEGAPIYGAGSLDYQNYLKVNELLDLQRPRSKPPHHDEMLFIIIHQAYELWFKLLIHEIENTIRYLNEGNFARARHFAARIVDVMKLLIRQIHLLESMQPIEFLAFRDHLKPASGFQSVQFREIEFLLGMKNPAYLRFFDAAPSSKARLEKRLEQPDLGVAFVRALRNKGIKIDEKDVTASHNDPEATVRVAQALTPIYGNPEKDFTLYQLCEKLLEMDEHFQLWRQHHVTVVERIIGTKIGTGGSSGVPYLRSTTPKRGFPYLWEIRTLLELPSGGKQ